MRCTWLCLVAVLSLPACDRSSAVPSAPTAPFAPTAPTAPRLPALSGTVRIAGLPVVDAKVALLDFATGAVLDSTMTDGNGSFGLSEVQNASPYSGALVSVSKPQHFTETKYILMSDKDQKVDFDLERAEGILVGEVIQSAVGVTARCASLGYGGGGGAVCRRFALTGPESGILEITVSSTPASPFDGTVLRPDGSIGVYGSAPVSPLRLTLEVTAGLTYQIDVVHISPATREFELNTRIR